MEETVKELIGKLIEEGITIRQSNAKEGIYGGFYLAGEEYEFWVTKCVDIVETNFKEHHLHDKLIQASQNAVGNDTKYYDEIISVLKILENRKPEQQIVESDDEPIVYEKIFISHASKDKDYVEQLIQLLNDIGISKNRNSIFCSSFEGYNIPIGEKIYDYIKKQFDKKTLVIFILSKNYYDSVACLNEMGATWVKSLKHISILLPDFNFSNIEGAIDPTEISFKFDNVERFNSLKDDMTKWFKLNKIDGSIWERDRKKFFDNINNLVRRDKYSNSLTRVDIGRIKGNGKNKLEIELRFINEGQQPVEFQELEIKLIDEIGNECLINVEEELLSKYIIYGSENRREVFIFDIVASNYNFRRNQKWVTNSSTISAF